MTRAGNWIDLWLNRHTQLDRVVWRMHQVLLRAKLLLGRLNRCVTQQYLDLLRLATGGPSELGAGSAKEYSFSFEGARFRQSTGPIKPNCTKFAHEDQMYTNDWGARIPKVPASSNGVRYFRTLPIAIA